MKLRFSLVLLALTATVTWAQPTIEVALDGTISEGEYHAVQVKNGFTIAASLSADASTVYLAVSTRAAGWIAIGIGSGKMDGSLLTMGFVAGGKPSISYELGKGNSHAPVTVPGAKAFVAESNGTTTLEVSLPAGSYVKAGMVQLIGASGMKPDFKSRHARYALLDLKL